MINEKLAIDRGTPASRFLPDTTKADRSRRSIRSFTADNPALAAEGLLI